MKRKPTPHDARVRDLLIRAADLTDQLEDICAVIFELLPPDDPVVFEVRDLLNAIR